LFGSEPTEEEEEEEEDGEEEEEKEEDDEEEEQEHDMIDESAAYQFLPIIIKINNEIQLTSEVPPFYPQSGHCRPPVSNNKKAAGPPAVKPSPSVDIYGDNVSEVLTSSANSDNVTMTGGRAASIKGGGNGMSQRCRTAVVERFENAHHPIVCRHLEGSPSRSRAGCCRRQTGDSISRKNNGYNGGSRNSRGRRGITASASGPTGRPQLVRQQHLDTDIHPDLTRKRHSCVPTVWFRTAAAIASGGGIRGRHRRTESI
jgi:hypothetical protein